MLRYVLVRGRSLVGLDWDRASVHGLEVGEASWAESAEARGQLRWALLLDGLQLLSGQLWQEALDAEATIEGQVALQLALGQISAALSWDDELSAVVAGDGVLLVLDFVGSGDGDASLLKRNLDLDLFWLESLDVEADVQHARAINWVDVDWVREGAELSHRGWAERGIADVRVELVPPRWLLTEPVGVHVRAPHWHVRAPHWPVATEVRPVVAHWPATEGRWETTEGRWETAEVVHPWVHGLLTPVGEHWVHGRA